MHIPFPLYNIRQYPVEKPDVITVFFYHCWLGQATPNTLPGAVLTSKPRNNYHKHFATEKVHSQQTFALFVKTFPRDDPHVGPPFSLPHQIVKEVIPHFLLDKLNGFLVRSIAPLLSATLQYPETKTRHQEQLHSSHVHRLIHPVGHSHVLGVGSE